MKRFFNWVFAFLHDPVQDRVEHIKNNRDVISKNFRVF